MIIHQTTSEGPLTAEDFALIKLRDSVLNLSEHFQFNSITPYAADRLTTVLRDKLTSYSNSTRLFMEISGRTQPTVSDVKASFKLHKIDLMGIESYSKYAYAERSEALPIFPVADRDVASSENAHFKAIYGPRPSEEELKTRPEHIPCYFRAIHPEWIKEKVKVVSKPAPRRITKKKMQEPVYCIPNFAEMNFSGFFKELNESREFEDKRRQVKAVRDHPLETNRTLTVPTPPVQGILKVFLQNDALEVNAGKGFKITKRRPSENSRNAEVIPRRQSQSVKLIRKFDESESQISLPAPFSSQQRNFSHLNGASINAIVTTESDIEQKKKCNQKRDKDSEEYKEYKRLKKEQKRVRREKRRNENLMEIPEILVGIPESSEEIPENCASTDVTGIDELEVVQKKKEKRDKNSEEYKEYKRLKKEQKRRDREKQSNEQPSEILESVPTLPKLKLKIKFGTEFFQKTLEQLPGTSFAPSKTPLKMRFKKLFPKENLEGTNQKLEKDGQDEILQDKENCDGDDQNKKISHDEPETSEKVWYCPVCSVVYANDKYMVGCDKCEDWFHWDCVGLTAEPTDTKWYCPKCINKKKTKNDKKRKASGVSDFNETAKKHNI